MKAVFAIALCAMVSAIQLTPIPKRYDGYRLGSADADFTLEIFMDHMCPGCAADWPVVYSYWQNNTSWLSLVVHIFPLPYHTNAFMVAQAGRYVQISQPDKFPDFIQFIFQHQDRYGDGAYYLNWNTIENMLGQDTQEATEVAYSQVIDALHNSTINNDVRVSWKYGCSRGITGTPTFLVNGVEAPEASMFASYNDWEHFFNSLK